MAQDHPNELRKFVVEALLRRGIFGGVEIYHHFRYNEEGRYWYRSIHLHVLGWVKGGHDRCRKCLDKKCVGRNKEFLRCDGFEAHTRACFEKDGVICKVAEDVYGVKAERRSIFRTAQYQLSHASIRTDQKRAHAVFWFGAASYHRFKFKVEQKKSVCPICGRELHRFCFVGGRDLLNFASPVFVTNRCSPLFKKDFLFPLVDGKGRAYWLRVFWNSGSSRGSGSYGPEEYEEYSREWE